MQSTPKHDFTPPEGLNTQQSRQLLTQMSGELDTYYKGSTLMAPGGAKDGKWVDIEAEAIQKRWDTLSQKAQAEAREWAGYSGPRRLLETAKKYAWAAAAVVSNNPKHQKDERDEISALMTDFTESERRPVLEEQAAQPSAAQRAVLSHPAVLGVRENAREFMETFRAQFDAHRQSDAQFDNSGAFAV